jgi:hypothetical protein
MIQRRIRLLAYGASQSPAAFAKLSADILVPFSVPVTKCMLTILDAFLERLIRSGPSD